jgi:hypothetical protein
MGKTQVLDAITGAKLQVRAWGAVWAEDLVPMLKVLQLRQALQGALLQQPKAFLGELPEWLGKRLGGQWVAAINADANSLCVEAKANNNSSC